MYERDYVEEEDVQNVQGYFQHKTYKTLFLKNDIL